VIGVIFLAVVLLAPNGILALLDQVRKGTKIPEIMRWWGGVSKRRSDATSLSDGP